MRGGGAGLLHPGLQHALMRDCSVRAETRRRTARARGDIVRALLGRGELDREHLVCLMLSARSTVWE